MDVTLECEPKAACLNYHIGTVPETPQPQPQASLSTVFPPLGNRCQRSCYLMQPSGPRVPILCNARRATHYNRGLWRCHMPNIQPSLAIVRGKGRRGRAVSLFASIKGIGSPPQHKRSAADQYAAEPISPPDSDESAVPRPLSTPPASPTGTPATASHTTPD
ncbi:hypothetical protein E2C01_086156 [Portunus trituberculatus]|uniref:Uncharacterized protein n=1 Tax=Portunus trituberculatus TaxID=210409 RepID=A0A5B7J8J2_PORTR|nr:hypothetical protein [Portunus trituberculatus]